MPKRDDDGYEDALSSIYDFIFNYNKEPSKPPRPVRESGVSGMDEMSTVMAELATRPLTYLPDLPYAPFKGIVGQKFVQIKLDEGEAEAVELKIENLSEALSDPNKFVDKVFEDQKEKDKWNVFKVGGPLIDQAVAAGLAKKAGMDMGDAWAFGGAARGTYKNDPVMTGNYGMREKHREVLAGNASIKAGIEQAKAQARNEGLNKDSSAYADRVYQLSKANKDQMKNDQQVLKKAMSSNSKLRQFGFVNDKGEVDSGMKAELSSELSKSISDPARVKKIVDNLASEVNTNNFYDSGLTGYRMAYADNQNMWAQLSDSSDEADRHMTAANYAMMWEKTHGSGEDIGSMYKKEYSGLGREIKATEEKIRSIGNPADPKSIELSAYLSQLESSKQGIYTSRKKITDKFNKSGEYWRNGSLVTGYSVPKSDIQTKAEMTSELMKADRAKLQMQLNLTDDAFEKRQLMAEIIRMDRGVDRMGSVMKTNWRERLSSMSHTRGALKGVTSGDLAKGMVSGLAYWKKDAGAPGAPGNSEIQVRTTDKDGDPTIGVRKSPGIILPRDDYNKYYSTLAGTYYLTPGSIGKTLFYNGEGFAYLAEMKQRGLQRGFYQDRGGHLSNFVSANPGLFSGGSFGDLFNPDGSVDNEILAGKYLEVMDILSANEALLSPQLAKILKQANGKYGSLNRFSKISDFMNNNIAERFNINNYRDKFLGNAGVQKALAAVPGASTGVQLLTGKLRVKTWVRGGVHSAAVALGIGTGFVATIAIEAVVWVGTEVGMRLAKVGMKISLIAFVGFCGLCGFLFFYVSGMAFDSVESEVGYTSMTPGEQIFCAGPRPYPDDETSPYRPFTLPPGMIKELPPTGTVPPGTVVMPAATGNVPADASCPASFWGCAQGPYGTYSHNNPNFPKTLASDMSGGPWSAPSDGYVIHSVSSAYCGRGGPDRGGELKFVDLEGNIYTLLHVVPSVQASNGLIKKGTQLAKMSTGLPTSACWNGAHYHLEVEQGEGNYVNSEQWYKDLGCNIDCP